MYMSGDEVDPPAREYPAVGTSAVVTDTVDSSLHDTSL